GDVVDGQLLVAGGQGTALLVPAHHLLDPAAAPVGLPVERPGAPLALAGRDNAAQAPAAQPGPDAGVAVALVRADAPGPAAAADTAGALRPQAYGREGLRRVP